MTWTNRLKMWGGALLVLVLCAGLTLLFNQRQTQAQSLSASVEAPVTVVSSAYGGIVTQQHVKEGDVVAPGQDLFVVTSAKLQEGVAQGVKPTPTVAYDVDTARGTITYKAVTGGQVTDVVVSEGSFVSDGSPLAELVTQSVKSVEAIYRLSPNDYGRIEVNAPVAIHLPNNQVIQGRVTGITVATEAGEAITRVTVASDELNADGVGLLTRRGTPVLALMSLRDDGPLAGPTSAMLAFLTKVGLR